MENKKRVPDNIRRLPTDYRERLSAGDGGGPVDGEYVTKADLKVLESDIKADIARLRSSLIVWLTGVILTAMLGITGIFSALIWHLFGLMHP